MNAVYIRLNVGGTQSGACDITPRRGPRQRACKSYFVAPNETALCTIFTTPDHIYRTEYAVSLRKRVNYKDEDEKGCSAHEHAFSCALSVTNQSINAGHLGKLASAKDSGRLESIKSGRGCYHCSSCGRRWVQSDDGMESPKSVLCWPVLPR